MNWIDRGVTEAADLRRYGRVAITGRMKVGKTREAAELMRRALDDALVPEGQIFELFPAYRLLTAGMLSTALRGAIASEAPVLFLVEICPATSLARGWRDWGRRWPWLGSGGAACGIFT